MKKGNGKGILQTKFGFLSAVITLGLFSLAVVLLFLRHSQVIRDTSIQEAERYISEIGKQIGLLVEDRLEGTLNNLHVTADIYQKIQDRTEADGYLKMVKDGYGYGHIGLLLPDGTVLTNGGRYASDWAPALFAAGFEGQKIVFAGSCPVHRRACLVHAVPLTSGGKTDAMLVVIDSKTTLSHLLSVDSFSQEGFSSIVDTYGNYIITSENQNAPTELNNYFRYASKLESLHRTKVLADVQVDIQAGGMGFYRYESEAGVARLLHYRPLGEFGWYLLSEVPIDLTEGSTQPLVQLSKVLALLLVVLLGVLLLTILYIYRSNRLQLADLTLRDSMTGGDSRTKFGMDAAAALGREPPGTWALIALDLQRFKLINESFGSEAGDSVLRYVHSVLKSSLCKGELLSRISADSFQLLLYLTSREVMQTRLEEIIIAINSFNDLLERKYYLSFAIGIYEVQEQGMDIITVQDRANAARKEHKRPKTEQSAVCTFYSDLERGRHLWEKEIDDRLDAALKAEEFLVYLQPKVALDTELVVSAEALARWATKDHGLVQPGSFVPEMERSGTVKKLDIYMFEQVCRLQRKWIDEGRRPMPVAVNLSRANLWQRNFLDGYIAILERYNVPADLIEMELTETLAVEDPKQVGALIHQLHAAGFRCAMDDFGAGYSCLNALKDLPVDVLKLDRAFFEPSEAGERGNQLIEAVIALAKKLNMKTVAEGVEEREQVEFLRSAGCDMVQGYYFSRPIPIPDFERLAFGDKPL